MVEKVGIIGLGLIGGSLARRLNANGVEVTAWNHRPHPYAAAQAEGMLDEHPGITLTDVGSVKGMVLSQVEQAGLGECYVGAHPMAGNELSGWAAADPHLYDGALWAITVRPTTAYRRFLTIAELIVNDCGNRLIVLDSDTHDRAAGLISHMPHVVATSLINELVDNHDRNIAAALAAGSCGAHRPQSYPRHGGGGPGQCRAAVAQHGVASDCGG